ncbi:MAG: enoyl-CoA hydratase/isomerase family protein [Chloroflexi bacterium]|nr:enoyl-CoA hydratase/isomerase family protein [Chloroflexota bacterium]
MTQIDTGTPDLIFEKHGNGVAVIVMNRPDKLNSWTPAMQDAMANAMKDCDADPRVRAIIITGAGDRAISSGADVVAMAAGADRRMAQLEEAAASDVRYVPNPPPGSPYFRDILAWTEKPLIAAVNGVTSGGGFGIALGADIRVMSENARFVSVYMRRGMVVSAETWFLPRMLGLSRAMQIILTAGEISAKQAEDLGLVARVVPRAELMDAAMEFAEKLADGPAVAMRFTKQAIKQGLSWDFATTMNFVGWARAMAVASGENREGARSFVEKRAPRFRPL